VAPTAAAASAGCLLPLGQAAYTVRAMAVTALCWCPRCQAVGEMRISPTLGLVVCPACDGAFTVAELQEAAYTSGYEDALAEAATAARGGRGS
jgi:hypothetical protein